MRLEETVQYVERTKLPRDITWLHNRCVYLANWCLHLLMVLSDGKDEYKQWRASPPPGVVVHNYIRIRITPVEMQATTDGSIRNIDRNVKELMTKVYKLTNMSPLQFYVDPQYPRVKVLKHFAVSYAYAKEDLERTLRSFARMDK